MLKQVHEASAISVIVTIPIEAVSLQNLSHENAMTQRVFIRPDGLPIQVYKGKNRPRPTFTVSILNVVDFIGYIQHFINASRGKNLAPLYFHHRLDLECDCCK